MRDSKYAENADMVSAATRYLVGQIGSTLDDMSDDCVLRIIQPGEFRGIEGRVTIEVDLLQRYPFAIIDITSEDSKLHADVYGTVFGYLDSICPQYDIAAYLEAHGSDISSRESEGLERLHKAVECDISEIDDIVDAYFEVTRPIVCESKNSNFSDISHMK